MKRLLILGSGMAAGKLTQELVRLGCRDAITVAGLEGPGIYNRIRLAHYLSQGVPEDFWVVPPQWFSEQGITVLDGHRALEIDRQNRSVRFSNGTSVPYDTLVLALGSHPYIPPIPGVDLSGVTALRTRADADRIRSDLEISRTILVVGGGLLGVETALEMASLGHRVAIAQAADRLMERQLDPTGSAYLKGHLEGQGIEVMTDVQCAELVGSEGRVAKARFRDGREFATDLVLLSAGIVPETTLAKAAGLEVGRGIVVDDRLRTSDPAIHAVGECLEWKGHLWGLVTTTFEQSRTLARILMEEPAVFEPQDSPPTRLKGPVFMASFGSLESGPDQEVFEFRDPLRGVYKRVITEDGVITGAEAVGSQGDRDADAWDALELAYVSGVRLDRSPGELLFSPRASDAADPAAWPDNLRVCNCNGVTAGELRSAVGKGARTLEAVMKVTKAGTGCSSCRARVRALVESQCPPAASEGRWKRFWRTYREKEFRGYTPYWIVSYLIDYLMFVSAVLVVVTGIIKFPGLLAALGFSIRRLPMDLFMVIHDWAGLAMTAAALAHVLIHWGMMVSFLRSLFRRRKP